MSRRFVNQLTPGEAVNSVFLVVDKQIRVNRQGGPYLHFEVRDRSGTIEARLWNVADEVARSFDTGDYVNVKGKVQLFQGLTQLIVSGVEKTSGSDTEPSDF